MITPPGPAPDFSSTEKEAFFASFQRGKLLVLALVVLTGVGYGADTLHGYLTGGLPAKLSDLLGGWAFVGFICWCVFRGGPIASGCLLITCVPLALGLLGAMGATAFNFLVPFGHSSFGVNQYADLGADWKSTIRFLPVGMWAVYACWVLLISKDARLYRRLRHREITEEEALSFEWKQNHRRQQQPTDAT